MSFTQTDLAALAAILRDAARSEILPRFRRLGAGAVRTKSGPLDLVTDADIAAEAHITAALERDFPGILVVGEEAAANDPSLVTRLAGAAMAVTVDPIDGTANYAAGLPLFGVMAAVVEHGTVTAAVILDPICDSFSACRRGGGAREHAADGSVAPLRAAPARSIHEMTGVVSWRYMPEEQRSRAVAALLSIANAWDHRCAAHEYRSLIAGHADFLLFNRLMPWDHLPGVLLHREAGGYAARFDGSAYCPGHIAGGLICAPDAQSWRRLAETFLDDALAGAPA